MIYCVTVTTTYEDGDVETYTYLSDYRVEESYSNGTEVYTSEVAKEEEVTTGMLLEAISSKMENGNFHKLTSFIDTLIEYMFKSGIEEEQVKNFLWKICNDKGFLLGL